LYGCYAETHVVYAVTQRLADSTRIARAVGCSRRPSLIGASTKAYLLRPEEEPARRRANCRSAEVQYAVDASRARLHSRHARHRGADEVLSSWGQTYCCAVPKRRRREQRVKRDRDHAAPGPESGTGYQTNARVCGGQAGIRLVQRWQIGARTESAR